VKRLLGTVGHLLGQLLGFALMVSLVAMFVVFLLSLAARGGELAVNPKSIEQDRVTHLLARCYDDPSLFNTAILRRSPYWWAQEEMARSVVANRVTVAYTGNAIGKDYLVGGIVPWWLYTRKDSLVIVTGPSQTLLGTVTWKEIRKALEGARFPMGDRTSVGAKASPQTVNLPGVGWQALGYSTTNVERASGQHNRALLVIVEEASGVEDAVWEALDSLKFTRLLAIGNPIRADGKFVDLIRQSAKDARDRVAPRERVHAIQVASTQSPHAHLDESPYGLADRTWLAAMRRQYGEKSLWWASHVDARVPTVSSDTLIPEAWLDWAAARPRLPIPPFDPRAGTRRIACDLGEGVGRDASCLFVRDDLGVLDYRGGNAMGLEGAATAIAELARKWQVEPEHITFDRMGLGTKFANHLARVGITGAIGYAGEGSPRSRDYTNLRTEAAFNLRTRLDASWIPDPRRAHVLQPHFHIPPGPYWVQLRDDLRTLTYDLVGKQTRLLPKLDHKARLGRSPDHGDTLLQSFA
jgi:hypothetical protein